LGVDLDDDLRYPLPARFSDFVQADRAIALSRREHEPMVESFFPAHQPLVGYWEVGDVEIESPTSAIEKMIELIERLLQEIQAGEPETI
jgi:protein-tyrosine phosphatase